MTLAFTDGACSVEYRKCFFLTEKSMVLTSEFGFFNKDAQIA